MSWTPIPNYEGIYETDEDGQIKSIKYTNGKILKSRVNKNGYPTIGLWKDGKRKLKYLHRIVAETFIPNPENKPEVNHIDGNKLNNHVSNLEWCDRSENCNHAIATGLKIPIYGERVPKAKLTEEDVLEIYKLLPLMKKRDIAELYGVHYNAINTLSKGMYWKHLYHHYKNTNLKNV